MEKLFGINNTEQTKNEMFLEWNFDKDSLILYKQILKQLPAGGFLTVMRNNAA